MATIDRTCRRCEETKPLEQFQKDKSRSDGYRHVCKQCANKRITNDAERSAARKHYIKQWKKDNPEYERTWKKENKDKVKANARRWYHKNYAEDIARWMLVRAKRRAKANNVPFDLAVEDIVVPEMCPALNIPLQISKGETGPNSPSLDRIVPELGYVRGNVIVVSMLANAIKTNATPEQIIAVGNFYANLNR